MSNWRICRAPRKRGQVFRKHQLCLSIMPFLRASKRGPSYTSGTGICSRPTGAVTSLVPRW